MYIGQVNPPGPGIEFFSAFSAALCVVLYKSLIIIRRTNHSAFGVIIPHFCCVSAIPCGISHHFSIHST